ncbi:5-hydroxyisourate hydrolase isoform X2 [Contarinia nasturtii]|uniref:5-hydroxyisourate hydrolase isoform X2 n=1 Tax=Contarinia nasturtii TaxID=265458 RepID=UPI0012D470E8|nr:5-hydroxyisourate hydrolase isoform X2 [Contarinia nasturtii]
MSAKSPISTHILDTSRGQPADGVSLYKMIDGNWALINESVTNADGRCADLLLRSTFQCGRYKLNFNVEKYYERLQSSTIYPIIEIIFDCLDQDSHYHMPLLLNPYGYTTYRGS